MIQLQASTIWLAANAQSRDSIVDANGRPIRIWKGNRVKIPVGLFDGAPSASTFVGDLSNITGANLVIRAGSVSGNVLVEKALTADDLNGALTYDQWVAREGSHFEFDLFDTDTNQPNGAIYIAIEVVTDDSGDVTVATAANAQIVEDGIGSPGSPAEADYTSYSKVQSDARYEAGLGNPASDNRLLSSLANGLRTWLATSSLGRTLLAVADAAAGRTALGLGTMATQSASAADITGGTASLAFVGVTDGTHVGAITARPVDGSGLAAGTDLASHNHVLNLCGALLTGSSSGGVDIGSNVGGYWLRAVSVRNGGNLLLMPDYGRVIVGAGGLDAPSIGATTPGTGAFTGVTSSQFFSGGGNASMELGLGTTYYLTRSGYTFFRAEFPGRFITNDAVRTTRIGLSPSPMTAVEDISLNRVSAGHARLTNGSTGDGNLQVGHLTFGANNTYDIGNGSGNDPRDGHFTRNVTVGGYITAQQLSLAAGAVYLDGPTGSGAFTGFLAPGSKTVGTIPEPDDVPYGAHYIVTDASGGAREFWSDNINWRDHARTILS